MAKIVDPDSLNAAVNATATTQEVEIQTAAKTVQLRIAGALDDTSPGKDSGATAKAVYSFLKEEWLANATLRRHRFPIKMIFEGSFIWVNGWAPADQQTRDLFRDAGFLEQATSRENACIVSLGSMIAPLADRGYYQNTAGFTAAVSNFDKTGEINENIQIVGAGGTPDNKGYLKLFLREQGKTYAEYNLLSEQGLAALTYQAYRLPLANGSDIKVTTPDATIDISAPYTAMKAIYLKGSGFTTAAATTYSAGAVVKDGAGRWAYCVTGGTVTTPGGGYAAFGGTSTWEAYAGEELIGSTYYAFNRIIICNGGTTNEIHEWAQRQLRRTTDINANDTYSANQIGFGVVNGNVAKQLTDFVGDTLEPKPGVLLRGFDANATNSIKHRPITVDGGGVDAESIPVTFPANGISFPFVAAGNFVFSDNIVAQADVNTIYTAYFEYITRTTGTDIGVSGVAGSTANIVWTGTTLDHLVTGDWLVVSGATNAGNNGVWEITGAVDTGANTAAVTKRDGLTPVNEAAAASITVDENPFDTPGAVIVQNNATTPLDGQVTAASIPWDFDFTNNNQGGRTPNTNAPIIVVALAKDGAEWISASHTITASVGQAVPVNAGDERNYSNPA